MINHTQGPRFAAGGMRPLTPVQTAQLAIIEGNNQALQRLIDLNEVNAGTHIGQGITLLMFAVQERNIRAFNALVLTFDPDRINDMDAHGNTLLHHMATHLNNRTMNTSWTNGVEDFLENFHTEVEWDQQNQQGASAPELAAQLDRTQLMEAFEVFIPDEEESEESDDSYASAWTDNSAGDGMKEALARYLQRKRPR